RRRRVISEGAGTTMALQETWRNHRSIGPSRQSPSSPGAMITSSPALRGRSVDAACRHPASRGGLARILRPLLLGWRMMRRRLAVGCWMMSLALAALPVAADDSWNKFFGLKVPGDQGFWYDITFFDHPGEGHFDDQGFRFQLFHKKSDGQAGSTANGRIQ